LSFEKNYDADRKFVEFFTISLRIVRPHIAEVSVWAVKVTVTVGDFWWNYPSVIATVAFLGQGIDCNCQLKKV
jgi:hypothetical protein